MSTHMRLHTGSMNGPALPGALFNMPVRMMTHRDGRVRTTAQTARWLVAASLLGGIASRLFVQTPFGFVAMFDLACFVLGPIIYVVHLNRFSQREHLFLGVILLWVFGAYIANSVNRNPTDVTLKAMGVVASLWCMSVVCLALLKRYPLSVVYFIMGSSIGAVISMYVFQNGALLGFAQAAGHMGGYIGEYLMEKQVMPAWLSLACVSGGIGLLSLSKRIPTTLVAVLFLVAAVFSLLQGGARSIFGVFMFVGIFSLGNTYFRGGLRWVMRHWIGVAVILIVGMYLAYFLYAHLALSGMLGEGEYQKYVEQFQDSSSGIVDALDERGSHVETFKALGNRPLGHGGAMAFRHAAVADGIHKEGIFAIPFWAVFFCLIGTFLSKHVMVYRKWAPFVMLTVVMVLWAALASPFGDRAMYCLVVCLALLASMPGYMDKIRMTLGAGARGGGYDSNIFDYHR